MIPGRLTHTPLNETEIYNDKTCKCRRSIFQCHSVSLPNFFLEGLPVVEWLSRLHVKTFSKPLINQKKIYWGSHGES